MSHEGLIENVYSVLLNATSHRDEVTLSAAMAEEINDHNI
ncbi:predicted protein [Botrytis cinerea T4]|uniref:Uncharacterized protein n=1 Tax=Botryotinia fuckeliana (strain T4) TaxID=999810 RepID=G2Y001_BOTF4|nr:predicted protein [Botrytis cinerea T4]